MKTKNLSKQIVKVSLGIFTTAVDLVLFTLLMLGEIGSRPGEISMFSLQKRLGRLYLNRKDRIIRDAIYRAQYKGWLEKDLKLTEEGKKRLDNLLPKVLPPKPWNGKWYLVIFDIPEQMKKRRDILREKLKLLGFSQLQASCWISPLNYFGNVKEILNEYHLQPYVIFLITDKLVGEPCSSPPFADARVDKKTS